MDLSSINLISILTWCLLALGGTLMSVCVWIGHQFVKKLTEIEKSVASISQRMNEIHTDIQNSHNTLRDTVKDQMHELDKRVFALEQHDHSHDDK